MRKYEGGENKSAARLRSTVIERSGPGQPHANPQAPHPRLLRETNNRRLLLGGQTPAHPRFAERRGKCSWICLRKNPMAVIEKNRHRLLQPRAGQNQVKGLVAV